MSKDSVSHIYLALSKIQAEGVLVERDSENPGFRKGNKVSTYASLSAWLNAYRPLFTRENLVIFNQIVTHANAFTGEIEQILETTLMSTVDGTSVCSTFKLSGATPQLIKASVTYGIRTNLICLITGTDVDDDGNEASGVAAETTKKEATATKWPFGMTPTSTQHKADLIEAIKTGKVKNEPDARALNFGFSKDQVPQLEALIKTYSK